MSAFQLHIEFKSEGIQPVSLEILHGEYHLVRSQQSEASSLFFNWLEGKKYIPDCKLELREENLRITDFLLLKKEIASIRFKLNEDSQFYYQQRYHATENEDIVKVKDFLGEVTSDFEKELINRFFLAETFEETVNMLSTGEFRKVFLLKSAFSKKKVFFIEEPFAGIDADSRSTINQLFSYLCEKGHSVVVVSNEQRKNFSASQVSELKQTFKEDILLKLNFNLPKPKETALNQEPVIFLRNISAHYNERTVLDRVSWEIKQNEKWRLSGKNGAGKSTLLSFIYADNPQVYSNEVYLFGKKRGSGESIWDIKDQIGFYSTEFHRYFNKLQTVDEAIRRIVFQNPYKAKEFTSGDEIFLSNLLDWFQLGSKANCMLYELPQTEQKIVLLIGTLLKNAPILILDEPFQGFDENSILKTRLVLDNYIENRTFILVTHNEEEVPAFVSKELKLEKGKTKLIR